MEEERPQEEARTIDAHEYVAPVLNRKAFHCPHCAVYAPHGWKHLFFFSEGQRVGSHVTRGECFNCHLLTYWLNDSTGTITSERPNALMVFPAGSQNAPPAHVDFPEDAKSDYEEARGIVDRSPRGAAALLRLSLQKLWVALGEPGRKINDDIASLVQKGLDPMVQQALDSLRVIGNNAVHPGQIDLRDDRDMAVSLFGLLNYIVEQQITRPKHLRAIYESLPASSLAQIQKRDSNPNPP